MYTNVNRSIGLFIIILKWKQHKFSSLDEWTNKIRSSYTTEYWEKAMAPHSSTLAWKIPWMEEPGRLQSMGSLRVGHD